MNETDREEGMLGEEDTKEPAAGDAYQGDETMEPIEDDLQDEEVGAEKQDRNPWILAGLGGLAVILIFAILTLLGVFEKEQPVVEDPDIWIIINEPINGAVLGVPDAIVVKGQGSGLFENNVVVEAIDGDGNVLVQEAAVLSSDEPGGAGEWSVDLDVHSDDVINGTIRAYSPSPADGSIMAESIIAVTFGEEDDEPQPDTSLKLEDALWALATLHGTDVISDTEITADFEDGEIAGSAGCNEYFASYDRTEESITFGDAGSTRMMCDEPEGIMDQEGQYLASLVTVETFRYAQGGLQMMDASSTIVLGYRSIVAGTVSFMPMIELSPDVVLTVQLLDVSEADAPATVIGETIVTEFDEIPIPFAVSYDPEVIDTRNSYALHVQITDGEGNLLFTNTTSYPVITQGNPSEVEVIVEPV